MSRVANPRDRLKAASGSVLSARRVVGGTAAVLVLLAAAACGSTPAGASGRSAEPSRTEAPGDTKPVIAVTYEDHEHGGEEGTYNAHAVMVAAGPKHVRYEIKATGFAPMLFVYDGQRLLVHDPEEYRPWSVYEVPEEHPDMYGTVSAMFSTPGSAEFARGCRSAAVVGHKTILGRSAVGYHCAAHFLADGSGSSAFVEWLDEKTNVTLQIGHFHATAFNEHPHISAATFVTEPPPGAKVVVYAAQTKPGQPPKPAPDFNLKRVAGTAETPGTGDGNGGSGSGGTIRLSDYAHRPLVLAFFASDLAFDPAGQDCAGCIDSLLTLQRLTDGDGKPAALAVQEGDEGKPGYPLIPQGLVLDVVNDPSLDVAHAYGLSEQVGFAFIGSDGTVHQIFNKAPSGQELKDAVDALR